MKEDSIIGCLICFVLGYLVANMMRGRGFCIGGRVDTNKVVHIHENYLNVPEAPRSRYSANILGATESTMLV